ncbi:MAG: hypothetical protein M1823_000266 [Watsoniomyces obsoletus]|nr:MAG: hypothetical protein M1823_000266 [Watsoniomyces obsoletus]
MSPATLGSKPDEIPIIPLSYVPEDSRASALRLVLSINPEWGEDEDQVEFLRFKDGTTNTLLKAVRKRPGLTEEEIDENAVLLRAYGKGTQILIDREREFTSHALLSQQDLAPPLLARFQNGLLYRFIRGQVCTPADLARERVWRGIAQRLGQWHAVMPVANSDAHATVQQAPTGYVPLEPHCGDVTQTNGATNHGDIPPAALKKPVPNVWTVMQKWVRALPESSPEELQRKITLQKEVNRITEELVDVCELGNDGLVFAHCDLLTANVILQPHVRGPPGGSAETVDFIDYEYATPAPAAFDLADHFAEWGGLECDYRLMPSQMQRRRFIGQYVQAYHGFRQMHHDCRGEDYVAQQGYDGVDRLSEEVDRFRGMPGLFWGIWALIQATISQINFDYASYAETRLQEYWDWRAETEGSWAKEGREQSLREKQWAREE